MSSDWDLGDVVNAIRDNDIDSSSIVEAINQASLKIVAAIIASDGELSQSGKDAKFETFLDYYKRLTED